VFARELSMPGQTVKLAPLAGSDLTARGYHAQVHAQDDSLALFHLDGGRRAIRQQDGRFVVGDQQFAAAALVEQATRADRLQPERAAAAGRAGHDLPDDLLRRRPNELAYLGQLRGVYAHFGVPMPLFYPRATATILDSAALRFLTKYKLPLEALQAQDEAALNELLQDADSAGGRGVVHAAEQRSTRRCAAHPGDPALDPTLEGAARSTLERMQRDLQTLHGKMIQAAKRRDETLRRQFMHARRSLSPAATRRSARSASSRF
jgi:uncharacterized protein YllA (UPF0747 family)